MNFFAKKFGGLEKSLYLCKVFNDKQSTINNNNNKNRNRNGNNKKVQIDRRDNHN